MNFFCKYRTASFVVFIIFSAMCIPAYSQCHGLHAGITSTIVGQKSGDTNAPYVMLSFTLVNDSQSALNVTASSWKIVVNGVELPDSDYIFGNGAMPANGWNVLQPGEHYELGKGLPIAKYFPHSGNYKVSWRGKEFESPVVTIAISNP